MTSYDAIVIGSGIGGLTCAALLTRLAGWRVLVLERHFKPGGQTHEFKRAGKYEWDVGLHYVGGMAPGRGERHLMDTITGGTVDWIPLPDPYDTFVYPGFRFEVPFGEARYRERLQARFPAQAKSIERYFGDLHKASSWLQDTMVRKALPPWLSVLSRVFGGHHEHLALSTTKAYLDLHFDDPLLRTLLGSQWGLYGLPPAESTFGIHAMATGSYVDGAYYPDGGGEGIARGALGVIEAGGGACRVNREVRELIVEGGRAVGVVAHHRQGERDEVEEYRAKYIVSDIGAPATHLNLIPTIDPTLRAEIQAFRHGLSAVEVFFGLHRSPQAIGLGGGNYWLFDDMDHDAMYRRAGATLDGKPPYAFVSLPSARDPHAIGHTATAVVMLDYESFEPWAQTAWQHRGDEYEQLKQTIAGGVIELAEKHLPGMRELIDYVEVSTPLTLEHFTARPFGAFYGVPGVPEKYRARWCDIETPLAGLYLTGTDVTAHGIMGAAMGGVLTTAKLLGPRELGRVMSQLAPE